jgi:hypothetical protein
MEADAQIDVSITYLTGQGREGTGFSDCPHG